MLGWLAVRSTQKPPVCKALLRELSGLHTATMEMDAVQVSGHAECHMASDRWDCAAARKVGATRLSVTSVVVLAYTNVLLMYCLATNVLILRSRHVLSPES